MPNWRRVTCLHAAAAVMAVIFAAGCGEGNGGPGGSGSDAAEAATGAPEETGAAVTTGPEPVPSGNGRATAGVASDEPSPAAETAEALAPTATSSADGAAAATAVAGESRAKREPIYDPEADGAALIAAALERARAEHKHVLIEWGGNWCGWCYKLHDVFTTDETVGPIVSEEFELVLLDQGANRALMEGYGGKDRQYAFPHLTVLDAAGNVLANQETGSLEVGPRHDPVKVAEFLKRWAPEPVDAEEALAAALRKAAEEDKRGLMRVGTPYCGWCKVLERFLREREGLFAVDYVGLKIDMLRMTHGEEVAGRFRPGESPGVPWMVILDASGAVLATSVGPEGNCGYPYHPGEIDHFLSMLTSTRRRMTDADVAAIRADLDQYRAERERHREQEDRQEDGEADAGAGS